MKMYTKPSVNVIELAIEENIAAMVPKTIYKRTKNATTGLIEYNKQDGLAEFSVPDSYFPA